MSQGGQINEQAPSFLTARWLNLTQEGTDTQFGEEESRFAAIIAVRANQTRLLFYIHIYIFLIILNVMQLHISLKWLIGSR